MPPKKGFLALDEADAVSYQNAKVVIIPFGLEASVSYKSGTSKGPMAIISASHEVELFDEELWCEPFRNIGFATLEEPIIKDSLEEALHQLEIIVAKVLDDGKFPFIFGGEHSLTAGSIRPIAKKNDDLIILHFDAHADLRDGYDGEHYSHASALRRCLDNKNIELVSIGIRNISVEEIPFLKENADRIHIYWAKDKANWNLDEITSHFKNRPIYLTFDVDGFDASLMPATGTPEPGGLFWDDAIKIIRAVSKVGNVVAADINELSPIENFHSADFTAAKLAYKILAYSFNSK